MTTRSKFRVTFTAIVLCCALVVTAIVNHAQSSALAVFSFFPYLLGVVLGANAHSPSSFGYILGLVVEWSVIGYVLSWPIAYLIVGRRQTTLTPADSRKSDANNAA